MILIYYFFAALLIYFSCKSLLGGYTYLDYFKREISKPRSDFTPFCSIIAPCKGLDEDLEKNLQALFTQDFPRYEIIFVADSENDAAIPVIEKLISKSHDSRVSASLIISGKSADEAQKIHNLREAVLHVSKESEFFVFVDSDARPGRDWLRNITAPLKNENVGCASGYRWFIGTGFSLPTEIRSVWNASIASQLGENTKSNFCWGGSMAIPRKIFEDLKIRDWWKGTLSDDFVVTRVMQEANLPIIHVPQCLTASIENCTFHEMREFTTRQMNITRVYSQKLWIMSFIGSGLFCSVMSASVCLVLLGWDFWIPLITILAVSILSIGKSRLRLKAVKLVLKDYEQELDRQFWTQNTLWLFAPIVFFYNCFCALLSRKIDWRGIKYELKSNTETVIISQPPLENTFRH